MTFEAALSFSFAVFVFSITPGPGVFAIMARALLYGAPSCFYLSLGMTISDMFYLIAACFGLAALATHWGELFIIVRLVGALYLIYLGWQMWNSPLNINAAKSSDSARSSLLSFTQGFLISASNPKVILFYIAFLPTFMDLSVLSGRDIALASVLTVLSLMVGLSAIAWSASSARRFFESEKGQKALNRSAGTIMLLAGAFLILKN